LPKQDDHSILSREEQKFLLNKIENKSKLHSNIIHTSIDDANITTERFNGTLKLS